MLKFILAIVFEPSLFLIERIDRADKQTSFMVERKYDFIILSFEKLLLQLATETPMVR